MQTSKNMERPCFKSKTLWCFAEVVVESLASIGQVNGRQDAPIRRRSTASASLLACFSTVGVGRYGAVKGKERGGKRLAAPSRRSTPSTTTSASAVRSRTMAPTFAFLAEGAKG